MQKNVASQKLIVFVFDSATNLPKTGDAANLTAYVSIDYGAVTVLGDTSATEMDATNAKGLYLFDLTQAETNGHTLAFSGKSSTSGIVLVPQTVYTVPANFALESIDSNGRIDVIKIAGTTQTARDIGASVLLSSGTGTGQISIASGIAKVDVDTIKTNPVVNAGTITFPTTATLASTTNITAGTVTTATNVTTVNGLAANVITSTSINNGALTLAKFGSDVGNLSTGSGTAQAGAASTITLATGAVATNNYYQYQMIQLTGGTGVGQVAQIASYVGSTRVATITGTWAVNPDNTTTYVTLLTTSSSGSGPTVGQIATAVWQDVTSGDFTVSGSIGKSLFTSGAVPGAAGGLFIAGTNAATTITTSLTTTFTGNLTGSVGSVTGAVGSVTGNVGGNVTGTVASVVGNVGGNVVGTVASVVGAVGSVTGNVGGNVTGSVASVVGNVGGTVATVTNLTNAPTAGDLTATMKTSVTTAASAATPALSSAGNNAVADAILSRALAAESYAADGAVPTLSQVLYLIQQTVGDFSITGTTITVKKLDGSTTAATYTLDSALLPTSRTRAT